MKKRRGRVFFIALGCSLLFIVFFPKTYSPETFFTGSWETPIRRTSGGAAEAHAGEIVPFQSETHYGYVTADGEILYSEPIFYNVTFSEDYCVNYAAVTENLLVKDSSGRIIQAIPTTGYPVFMKGRLFVIDKDRCGISEWDVQGNQLWRRRFSSLITAFDCAAETVLIGFLNGEIILLDKETKELFRDIPTGSRIRIIYGLAVTPGTEYFAVMMGIDPQRLVIYRKSETGYRPYHSEELEGNYRRETFLQCTDDHTLFYEQPGFLVQYDIPRKEIQQFEISGIPIKVILEDNEGLLFIHHTDENRGRLDVYTPTGMPLSYVQLPQHTYVHFQNGSLFFTADNLVKKIDIRWGGEN